MMRTAAIHARRGAAWLPVAAIVTVLALGGAAGWWYLAKAPTLPADEGQAIVDSFLLQVRQGKIDLAWQATAADFKSYLGREAFRAYVNKHPELKQPLQFQTHTPAGTAPFSEYVYQPIAAAKTKTPRTIKVRLVQEAEAWKVESLAIQ